MAPIKTLETSVNVRSTTHRPTADSSEAVLCSSCTRHRAVQLAVQCSRLLRVVWITIFSVLWLLEQAASSQISSATLLKVREPGFSESRRFIISSFNRIVLTFRDRLSVLWLHAATVPITCHGRSKQFCWNLRWWNVEIPKIQVHELLEELR